MKFTNKHGLPEPVRLWLEFDEYDYHPGIYSATRIMKPTRMVVLEKRHEDELEVDISDEIAKRYGHAIHDSFEKVCIPNSVQEHRFFGKIEGHEISGKPDILIYEDEGMVIWDIKSTSVWTYIYGSRKEDYIKQVSIYRWLVTKSGSKPVSRDAKIIYIFTDWSRSKAKKGGDYPPLRIVVEDIKLMSTEETEAYILGRLGAIHHYIDNPDEKLPPCTREELWQKDDQWAVMKKGRKSALRVFDDLKEATTYETEVQDGTVSLEHRPGLVNRCTYCTVTKWCDQFKELQEKGLIAE